MASVSSTPGDKYADFTIECDDEYDVKVHANIVCPQMPAAEKAFDAGTKVRHSNSDSAPVTACQLTIPSACASMINHG